MQSLQPKTSKDYIKLSLSHTLNTNPDVAPTLGKPSYQLYCVGAINPLTDEGPVPVLGGLMCSSGPEHMNNFILRLLEKTDLDESDLVKIIVSRHNGTTRAVYKTVADTFDDLAWVSEQIEGAELMLAQNGGSFVLRNELPFDA